MKKRIVTHFSTFSFLLIVLLFSSDLVVAQNLYISGGNNFSMTVCDDGKIKTWGHLFKSQGVDTTVLVPTDVPIPSDLKFSQADAGSGYHVIALDCNNKVWAFGRNDAGQLGIPFSAGSTAPVPVTGLGGQGQLSGAIWVSGANEASYAILDDGRLVAWGQNQSGQLGNGTQGTNSYIPNYVLKAANTPLTNIRQVDAGDVSAYALDIDGYVWAWGENGDNELGRNTNYAPSDYAQYVLKADGTPLKNIISISGGDKHGLALDEDGTVWSWGGNWGPGQLGTGTTGNPQAYAAQVVGVGGVGILSGANYIAAGQASSMVVLDDGRVVTFGSNALYGDNHQPIGVGGNLGQGSTNPSDYKLAPGYVVDCQGNQLKNMAYVSDGDAATYIIAESGDVYVIGGNSNGELGLGNTTQTGCATKLDLAVKYNCGLPDECPAPNLGPDDPVCSAADLAKVTLYTPQYRTYVYTWYYRTNDSTSFSLIANADSNVYKPTQLGQYMVKVVRNSNSCTTCKPGYDTITVDQSGINSTFCSLDNNTLNFSVTGIGIYNWYKSASGNDLLASNTKTYTTNINNLVPMVSGEDSVYSLYVEDTRTYTGKVGPVATANLGPPPYNVTETDNNKRNQMVFNVYNTLTLKAVWIKFFNYGNTGNYNVTLQLLDGTGNPIGSVTNSLAIPNGNNGLVDNAIRFPLGPNGITLAPGTGYVLKLSNGQGVGIAFYNTSNVTYPIVSTDSIAGRISLLGPGTAAYGATSLAGFINWEISSTGGGYPCGRLKVSLTRRCPCAAPKINLVSSTNAFSFCKNGSSASLTLTANAIPSTPPYAPLAYRYQWYKNETLINPNGNLSTLPVNSSDGIATYSVRVGHTSVNRSRCYTDTTFKITLQDPISNNVIKGSDTICPGDTTKQKLGVGTVIGGLGTTTYQWVSSTTGKAPWTNVASNGTSVSYNPGPVYQTTYFRRIVTNKGVCPVDTSSAVWAYTLPSIVPGTLNASVDTICENSTVTISATAPSGGIQPYKYSWYTSTNGGTFTVIPNETKADLIKPTFTLTQTTTIRRDVASFNGGCPARAFINITVDKKVIGNNLTDNLDQKICDGQPAQLIGGSLPGDNGKQPTYKWLSSNNAKTGFAVIANATDKDYSPGVIHGTTYFKRVVTSSGVCKNDTATVVAKVFVDPNVIAGTIIPALFTICNGTSPIINKGDAPTGGTTPYTFNWQYLLPNGNWTTISGFTGEGPLNVAPAITTTAQYRRIVNSLVCKDTTATVAIAVTGQMLPGSIHGTTLNICPGKIAGSILNDVVASGGTGNKVTYQWQSSTDGNAWSNLPTNATDSSFTPSVGLSQDTYFRRRATNGSGQCDTVYAGPVKIIQYKPLNPGAIELKVDSGICIGNTVTAHSIALPSDGSPTKTYNWVVSYPPSTVQTDTAINAAEITIPNFHKDMILKRVVSDECTIGDTSLNVFSVKVIQKTVPDITFITDLSKVYCNSTDLTVKVSTKNAGKDRAIDWTYNGTTSRSQPDSIFTVSMDKLVNGATIKVTITSDPTLFCTQTTTSSAEIPVTIDTKLGSNAITSDPESKCSTSPLDSIYASPASGTKGSPAYEWQVSLDNSAWTDLSNTATQNYFPATILGNRYYRRIAYSAGTCLNDTSGSVKIFVDKPIVPGEILALSNCDNDSVSVHSITNASGGTGAIRYSWMYSADNGKNFNPIGTDSVGLFINDKIVLDNSGTVVTFYFERIANSIVCSDTTAKVAVGVCQNPIIPFPLRPVSQCEGEDFSGQIIRVDPPKDYSPNGNPLIVSGTPVMSPSHGSLQIDNRAKRYTYHPNDPTFVGTDSAIFSICDSITHRCTNKKLYIKYLPKNNAPNVVSELIQTYRNQSVLGANILANDSDVDGDTLYVYPSSEDDYYLLKVRAASFPDSNFILTKHGRIQINVKGELSYEPDRDLALHDIVYDTATFLVCDYSSTLYCNPFFCKKDTVVFEIKPYRIFVPDGFSPNEDGVNDNFVIRSEVPLDIELKVYNRWGNLVYENKHYQNDWNGNANRGIVIGQGLPDGTYYVHYDVHDKLQDPGFKYITINR